MLTRKELLDETYNTLELVEKVEDGLIVYNKPHFKENLIYITNNFKIIKQKLQRGWSMFPGKYKYILQAPEAVLADLSELQQNPTKNLAEILTLFRSINKYSLLLDEEVKRNFLGLDYRVIDGLHCNLEIRVVGSDIRVKKLSEYIFNIAKGKKYWQDELKITKEILFQKRNLRIYNKKVSLCNKKTKDFHKKLKEEYKIMGSNNIPNDCMGGFWSNLPKADIYLFVPKSGLKYANGFINDTSNSKKIMLWECHLSLDKTKELVCLDKEVKGKRVAIIDRSYSSNTLDFLEEKIVGLGGYPIKIAIFPKSKRAIEHSDYFIFIDKIYNSRKVNYKGNWQERIFISTVNDKEL